MLEGDGPAFHDLRSQIVAQDAADTHAALTELRFVQPVERSHNVLRQAKRFALGEFPFRREDVGAVLDRVPLREYFGAITRDEILDTLFYVD